MLYYNQIQNGKDQIKTQKTKLNNFWDSQLKDEHFTLFLVYCRKSDILCRRTLLPSSQHQQVVIKTPWSILDQPLELGLHSELELEDILSHFYDFDIISLSPYQSQKIFCCLEIEGFIAQKVTQNTQRAFLQNLVSFASTNGYV